jgi:predicted RNase H-like nuclease (RuvC/YqgF family)
MWTEVISLLVNVVLGSGLVVTLVTIKSTKKKAETEERQAEMDLSKTYVEEFTKNIIEPLKIKLESTTKEFSNEINSLKREIARFRKAIDKRKNCPYIGDCSIERELQKSKDDNTEIQGQDNNTVLNQKR